MDPTPPRNSILPSTFLLRSPRPALCYRPLPALRRNLSISTVTRFEPRTPHQPEKLKKLSKNDSVFTPSIFYVNQNYTFVTTPVFNRVHAVHSPMTENGAPTITKSPQSRSRCWFARDSYWSHVVNSRGALQPGCENRVNQASDKHFAMAIPQFSRFANVSYAPARTRPLASFPARIFLRSLVAASE